MENIKNWVMDDNTGLPAEEQNLKHNPDRRDAASDSEMLKTYSTGLLAVCLVGYAMLPKL